MSKVHNKLGTAYHLLWSPSENTTFAGYFTPEEAEPILQHFNVEER